MSKTVKEIVKAIYVKLASDELEFVTICSKEDLNRILCDYEHLNPTSQYIVKTYSEIEPELEYYKFIVYINEDNSIEVSPTPCNQDEETFNIRHILKENRFVITLAAYEESEAVEKIHELWCLLYSKKYAKNI